MKFSSERLVLQIGDTTESAARHMSQLRGRPLIKCTSLREAADELNSLRCSTLLIAANLATEPYHDFLGFARRAAEVMPNASIGFLYGRDARQLLKAAERLPAKPLIADCRSQTVFAYDDFKKMIGGARIQDAGQLVAGGADYRQLISEPNELIFMIGHSNGHDAGIGKLVLCRHASTPPPLSTVNAFPCYAGEDCKVISRGMITASADEVGAKRVISLCCWGVTLADHPFSTVLSVGEGLLRFSNVETLVCATRGYFITREDFLTLYYFANTGLSLGAVANKGNRCRIDRGLGAEFLCFGDPETSILKTIDNMSWDRTEQGKTFYINLPPLDRPKDLALNLHDQKCPHSYAVLLDSKPQVQAGVMVSSDSKLFLTVAPSLHENFVRADLLTEEDLSLRIESYRQLFEDLPYFDSLFHATAERLSNTAVDLNSLTQISAQIGVMRNLLKISPLAHVREGMVIFKGVLEQYEEEVMQQIDTIADQFVRFYVDSIDIDFAQLAHSHYRLIHETDAKLICQYCGSRVSEKEWSPIFERCSRHIGFCDSCGIIYEGDTGLARWLITEENTVSDFPFRVSITASNPYTVPMRARGAVVFTRFHKGGVHSFVTGGTLAPEEVSVLTANVVPPTNLSNGVYYLLGILLVGLRVVYFRRPLIVHAGPVRKFTSLGEPQ
jgi:hypothetical protein